jgi:hypothetical protein
MNLLLFTQIYGHHSIYNKEHGCITLFMEIISSSVALACIYVLVLLPSQNIGITFYPSQVFPKDMSFSFLNVFFLSTFVLLSP